MSGPNCPECGADFSEINLETAIDQITIKYVQDYYCRNCENQFIGLQSRFYKENGFTDRKVALK